MGWSTYGTWLLPVLVAPPLVLCAATIASSGKFLPRRTWSWPRPTQRDVGALLAALAIVAGYVFVMFKGDELVGIDIAHLTVNRFIDPVVSPTSGRFFPLAFQWYNLLAFFGKSAALYHTWATLELVVLAMCVLFLLRELPVRYGVLGFVYVIALPSISYVFMNLPYPERDIVVCLALWAVAIERYRHAQSRWAFCGAMVMAQVLLYQKETSFVLIGGFSAVSILLRCSCRMLSSRRYADWIRTNALELAHLALCVIFLAVYAAAILPHVTASYAAGGTAQGASSRALVQILRTDLVLVATAMVLFWRLARRQRLDAFWEPLAVGALAFALAYVKLGMVREYYLAPADVLCALYLARVGFQVLPLMPRVAVAGLGGLLVVSFAVNIGSGASSWAAKRMTVQGHVQLESFLRKQAESRSGREISLFFPQPGGFEVMEFAAYLHFKGWTAKDGPAPLLANGPTFTLKTRHRYDNERCFMSQSFRCRTARMPEPGDLIVLLPGRSVAFDEFARWCARADRIFYYAARRSSLNRALTSLSPHNAEDANQSEAFILESRPTDPVTETVDSQ